MYITLIPHRMLLGAEQADSLPTLMLTLPFFLCMALKLHIYIVFICPVFATLSLSIITSVYPLYHYPASHY
jgi:hypothetical protein